MTLTLSRPAVRDDGSEAPRATRTRPPGWRNPRLLLGLLLVAVSVVVGARVLASADDTVPVWAVGRDLAVGSTLSSDDLVVRQLRFPDEGTADEYVSASRPLPAGATLSRAVSSGELLPRAALATGRAQALVEVPLGVAADDLPATVEQGSHVDVWVTPRTGAATQVRATRVLSDVVVVAVPGQERSLAPQETRQVIVGVPADRADSLGTVLGGLADGRVVVARRG